MKGIIVEINKSDAVVLTDDGLFTKVKNQNYMVGQTIKVLETRKFVSRSRLVAGAATMAAAFAVCTIGAYAWYTPTDYVSMDVNPSVEYSLNVFDRILDVHAVNDDGAQILEDLDLSSKRIEDAVKETLDQLMADGYLTDDPDGGVVITTSNDELGDAEQLASELEQEVQNYLDDQDGITAKVDAKAVAPDRVEEARELGVTAGKLNLVEKLQSSTTGAISREEWLTKPVREINKAIKENRKMERDDEDSFGRSDDDDDDSDLDFDDEDSNSEDKAKRPERHDNKRQYSDEDQDDQQAVTTDGIRWNDRKQPRENDDDMDRQEKNNGWKQRQDKDDSDEDSSSRDRRDDKNND